jgi:hypothetical protein
MDNETVNIESELAMLQRRYAREEDARKRRAEAQDLASRQKRRRELLSGEWRPYCQCSECCKAILSLSNSRCERWGYRPPWDYEPINEWGNPIRR